MQELKITYEQEDRSESYFVTGSREGNPQSRSRSLWWETVCETKMCLKLDVTTLTEKDWWVVRVETQKMILREMSWHRRRVIRMRHSGSWNETRSWLSDAWRLTQLVGKPHNFTFITMYHKRPRNATWFFSETLALHKSLTYLLTCKCHNENSGLWFV